MSKRKTKIILFVLIVIIISHFVTPVFAGGSPDSTQAKSILKDVESLVPTSARMVDNAIIVLSKGWSGMSSNERELFQRIYDPGDSGEIDERFIRDVLNNYQRIRQRLNGRLTFQYENDSEMCNLMRLYYTDLVKVHVCPYFKEEASDGRKARVLIHEVAHMALFVVDRPYYDPKSYSSRYNALTPRGSWTSQIPLLGPIFREISQSDTLYHPDAYSWFAAEQDIGL